MCRFRLGSNATVKISFKKKQSGEKLEWLRVCGKDPITRLVISYINVSEMTGEYSQGLMMIGGPEASGAVVAGCSEVMSVG